MSQSKSKCLYSNNCLQYLKRAVPLDHYMWSIKCQIRGKSQSVMLHQYGKPREGETLQLIGQIRKLQRKLRIWPQGPYSQPFIFFVTYKWNQQARVLHYSRLEKHFSEIQFSLLGPLISYKKCEYCPRFSPLPKQS